MTRKQLPLEKLMKHNVMNSNKDQAAEVEATGFLWKINDSGKEPNVEKNGSLGKRIFHFWRKIVTKANSSREITENVTDHDMIAGSFNFKWNNLISERLTHISKSYNQNF